MYLSKIRIQNYKSLRNVESILHERVTIIIGKNNVGKSNILDVIAFVSELAKGNDLDVVLQRRGGFLEVLPNKDSNLQMSVKLTFTLSDEELTSTYSTMRIEVPPLERFLQLFNREVMYSISFGVPPQREFDLLEECILFTYNGKENVYAKGFQKDGMYHHSIISDFKKGLVEENWELGDTGGSSPPRLMLHSLGSQQGIAAPELLLPISIANYLKSVERISPVRDSPEKLEVSGQYKVEPDCSNFPQVLNTIASSRRKTFDRIGGAFSEVIDDISDVCAFMAPGERNTYLSMAEKSSLGKEFLWRNIGSGTKEVLYLLTFLHTTPRGTFLMIEEPELHLHGESLLRLVELIKRIATEENKQIVMTTHSEIFIDKFPFEQTIVVTKQDGVSEAIALKEYGKVDDILLRAGIRKSWILVSRIPSFIMLVEGRDDVKIFEQFFLKAGISPTSERIRIVAGTSGGGEDAVEAGKFLKKIRSGIPFMIVLDSDNEKSKLTATLLDSGFSQDQFHVLSEKEIETYITDAQAISRVTGKGLEEVRKNIEETKGSGKERLEKIFEKLGFTKPGSETKELLVANLEQLPDEIDTLLKKISSAAGLTTKEIRSN